mmetsp:Transcript_34815/g.99608  ORF Transcript_34815/g.99608 Transcript_34815/m.99608 type:complete len:209 (-) Transcript_34815:803-1429(-)
MLLPLVVRLEHAEEGVVHGPDKAGVRLAVAEPHVLEEPLRVLGPRLERCHHGRVSRVEQVPERLSIRFVDPTPQPGGGLERIVHLLGSLVDHLLDRRDFQCHERGPGRAARDCLQDVEGVLGRVGALDMMKVVIHVVQHFAELPCDPGRHVLLACNLCLHVPVDFLADQAHQLHLCLWRLRETQLLDKAGARCSIDDERQKRHASNVE